MQDHIVYQKKEMKKGVYQKKKSKIISLQLKYMMVNNQKHGHRGFAHMARLSTHIYRD